MDSNWSRWIYASFAKHFSDVFKNLPIPLAMVVEGEDPGKQALQDYCEFRLNGPNIKEISKDYYRLEVVVNLLFVCKRTDKSAYKIYQNSGVGMAAFKKAICTFRYGSGIIDDQSELGCMLRVPQNGQEIEVVNLGQLNPDIQENQAIVQGYYRMLLEAP